MGSETATGLIVPGAEPEVLLPTATPYLERGAVIEEDTLGAEAQVDYGGVETDEVSRADESTGDFSVVGSTEPWSKVGSSAGWSEVSMVPKVADGGKGAGRGSGETITEALQTPVPMDTSGAPDDPLQMPRSRGASSQILKRNLMVVALHARPRSPHRVLSLRRQRWMSTRHQTAQEQPRCSQVSVKLAQALHPWLTCQSSSRSKKSFDCHLAR